MATRTLTVKLVGDTKGIDGAFRNVGSKMAGLGRTAGKLGLGLAGAFGAAVVAATPLIRKASDLNEELSKSEAVFGGASAAVQAFGKDAATSIGLSETAALAAVNRFGQFGKAAGLTGNDLSSFGTDLATLSADLASFNNLEVGEAAEKLAAGLSGEAEPLKALGIFMTAAAVEAKGLELGLGDVNGKLSEQEKILARQAIILEQTTDAQGDFARTSDGLANKSRILSAQFENLQIRLGQKFLPIALQVGDALLRLIDKVGPKIEPVFEGIATAVLSLSAAFKMGGLAGVGKLLVSQAGDIWDKLSGWISETTPKVIAKVKEWAPPFFEWIGEVVPPLLERLGRLLGGLATWITQPQTLGKISEKLVEWAQAFVEWITPHIPKILEKLAEVLGNILIWIVTEAVPQLVDAFFEMGAKAGSAAVEGIKSKLSGQNLASALGGLAKDVGDAFFGLGGGGNALDEVVNGVTTRSRQRGDSGPQGNRSILGSGPSSGTILGVAPSSGPRLPGGISRSGGGSAGDIILQIDSREVARATRDGSVALGGLDIKLRGQR